VGWQPPPLDTTFAEWAEDKFDDDDDRDDAFPLFFFEACRSSLKFSSQNFDIGAMPPWPTDTIRLGILQR